MYSAGKMLGRFQFALHKSLVDDDLRRDISEFTPLPHLYLLPHRSKLRCMRSTPTEMQSMSENDFECFASTGVNTPGTMFPRCGSHEY